MKKVEVKVRTVEEIAKENKAFDSLKPKEKRLAIVEDALMSIRTEKYIAETGDYVDVARFDESEGNLQTQLIAGDFSCEVCAMGAVFLSKAKLCNKAKFDVVKDSVDEENNFGSKLVNNLRGIFSPKQLRLMECAFEGTDILATNKIDSPLSDLDVERAIEFRDNSDAVDDEEILVLILENIIENDGTFKP